MEKFYSFVDRCNGGSPRARRKIEAEMWRTFGVVKTVFILDMSGFTVTVQRKGIIDFLCKIRRMHQMVSESLAKHGGELVKFEADNAYAVFQKPASAVRAALEIVDACHEDRFDHLSVSIGIATGRIMLVPGKDFFGDAVNLASKLGEDIAESNEVLVSQDVAKKVSRDPKIVVDPLRVHVSGVKMNCARVFLRSSLRPQ